MQNEKKKKNPGNHIVGFLKKMLENKYLVNNKSSTQYFVT